MTAAATVWAWTRPLPPISKLVLLALAEMAGSSGGHNHAINLDTAIDDLVELTGCARRTVQTHLRKLEQSHHIVREDRADTYGKRLPNRWHLNVNELAPVPLDLYPGGSR